MIQAPRTLTNSAISNFNDQHLWTVNYLEYTKIKKKTGNDNGYFLKKKTVRENDPTNFEIINYFWKAS